MTPLPGSITPVPRPHRTWLQRLGSILLVIFCLELGLFLLIYPWTESWSDNYFSSLGRGAVWSEIWNNGYLRGAVSGLGLLNIWVAVAEALRMFSGGEKPE